MLPAYSQLPLFLPQPNAQSGSRNTVGSVEAKPGVVLGLMISPFGAGFSGSPCTRPSPAMHSTGPMHDGSPGIRNGLPPSNHERGIVVFLPVGLSWLTRARSRCSP